MFNSLTIFIVLMLVVVNSQGCSFIKEHFARKEVIQLQEQQQEEGQKQETPRKVEPIPINPQHS